MMTIRLGRASRTMDLVGLALLWMTAVLLWVQDSVPVADTNVQTAPDAVSTEVGWVKTTGSVVFAGAEHP